MTRGGIRPLWLAATLGAAVTGSTLFVLWHMSVFSRRDTIRELQEAPLNSSVHLVAIVTYTDDPGNRFWIQDDSGAMPIDVSPVRANIHVGQTVAIEGIKTARYNPIQGPVSVALKQVSIRSSAAHVKLPEPVPATLDNFPTPDKNGIQVQITGFVRSAGIDKNGRAEISLAVSGPEIDVIVAKPTSDYSKLVGAKVRIVGVPEQTRSSQGARVFDRMWVASGSDLQIDKLAPAEVSLYSIRTLYIDSKARSGNRIRIRGQITAVSTGSVLLEDRWGEIECRLDEWHPLKPGTTVEVEGFPSREGLRINLYHARAVAIPAELVESKSEPGSKLPVLATVRAVRDLPPSKAAMALPVHVTGVITYEDSLWHQLYLQDKSGGIYVGFSGDHPELLAGERVTLSGITGPGDYAPVIVAPKFRVGGMAPLPVPIPVTVSDVAAGLLDAQYATIEGVIHPLKFGEESSHPKLTFDLFTDLGRVHVYTSPLFPDLQHSKYLEDAKARIRGVFGTVFNSRRQLVGYQFLVESPSDIDVTEPAIPNPFGMEPTPIEDLLRFSSHAKFGHRVKVKGTITLAERDSLYLQDATDGVEIQGDTHSIHLGDLVEAIGYPTLVSRYSPVLTDAVVRSVGGTGHIVPKVATAESILEGHDDSMVVTVEGRLLMELNEPARKTLVLQSGVRTFSAQLDTSGLTTNLPQLGEGSILRLTGVCFTQVNPNKLYTLLEEDPSSFQILLRSPQDLTVVRSAPFWTLQTTLVLLTVLSLLIPVTLIWVGVLRRRVRMQMAALQKAAETSQAIEDLSISMQNVSKKQRFDTQVSVRGNEDIAQLVVGFNSMLAELQVRDRAKKAAEAKLEHMAMFDELTGLPNRRLLSDRLSQSLARAEREGEMLALLYIDLDGFKLVNDTLGHSIGDRLLCQVAQRLRSRSRQSDTLARIGGDEFTLVLNNIQSESDAEKTAQSLLEALVPPFPIDANGIRIGASIGISIFPDQGIEGGSLLQQADYAMYAAKRNGKNRIVRFGHELGNATRKRLTLESDLRRAVAEGAITVHYQPEFDLATNSIVRFEALARWTHPTLGAIPPSDFIPIAEENGLIIPLGAFIMERACRDAVAWQSVSDHAIQVAVNVSSVQFAQDSFVDEVEDILRRTGLKPTLLQIELTESATLVGIERAAAAIKRLKSIGVSVAIDDFGTGYSCLNYLPKFSFDALKIDRSFVNDLMVRPETSAFVQSILTMAHNLHMRVIVEGIETKQQLQRIEVLGADGAQGYFLARPSNDPVAQLRLESDMTKHRTKTRVRDLEAVP
jgi:diguanylate cyclase (GGDEF)-like protein